MWTRHGDCCLITHVRLFYFKIALSLLLVGSQAHEASQVASLFFLGDLKFKSCDKFIEGVFSPFSKGAKKTSSRKSKPWENAESYFWNGDWSNARKRYLGLASRGTKHCKEAVALRIADCELRMGSSRKQVLKRYKEIYDRNPSSLIGKYAQFKTLLILKLDGKANTDILYQTLLDFPLGLRRSLELQLLLAEMNHSPEQSSRALLKLADSVSPSLAAQVQEIILTHLEQSNRWKLIDWIETLGATVDKEPSHSVLRKKAIRLYMGQFDRVLSQTEEIELLIQHFQKWKNSTLWDPFTIASETRDKGTYLILKTWISTPPKERDRLAKSALECGLGEILKGTIAWTLLESIINPKGTPKIVDQPCDISGRFDEEGRDKIRFDITQMLIARRDFQKAEVCLSMIQGPKYQFEVLSARWNCLLSLGRYEKAFEIGTLLFERETGKKRKARMEDLLRIAWRGALWKKAPELLALAKLEFVRPADLVKYHYFSGRASMELGDTSNAISEYTWALRLDPQASQATEARFRLAQCLAKDKKIDSAKIEWQSIAKGKDRFWRRLAENELNRLKEIRYTQ